MNNQGVKWGLICGGISVFASLIMYLVNPELLFNWSIGMALSWLVPSVCMYMAAKATREDQEGIMSFGEALQPAFLTYALGSFVAITFTYVLYNIVDPSLMDIGLEKAKEAAQWAANLAGGSEEANEAIMSEFEGQEPSEMFGLGTHFVGWAFGLLIPGIIIALIIAAITKREND